MVDMKRLSARVALVEAAFKVLGQDPSAPLSRIAEAAGVGRATLHRHFPSRSDLIGALMFQASTELDEAATFAAKGARSHGHALEKIMAAVIELGDRQWFLARESESVEPHNAEYANRQKQDFRRLMENARDEGLFPQSCPIEWAIAAYDHLIYAAWIMVREGEVTPKQAARLAWVTLISGMAQARL